MSHGTGGPPEIARLVLTTSESPPPWDRIRKVMGSTLEMHVVDVTLKLLQQSFFKHPTIVSELGSVLYIGTAMC